MADDRQSIRAALQEHGQPMSLYELMTATKIGGWDVAQAALSITHDGAVLMNSQSGCTLYRLRDETRGTTWQT